MFVVVVFFTLRVKFQNKFQLICLKNLFKFFWKWIISWYIVFGIRSVCYFFFSFIHFGCFFLDLFIQKFTELKRRIDWYSSWIFAFSFLHSDETTKEKHTQPSISTFVIIYKKFLNHLWTLTLFYEKKKMFIFSGFSS